MLRQIHLAVLLLCPLLLASEDAFGAVTGAKSYPGSLCRPIFPSYVSYSLNNGTFDTSQSMTVNCPIVRDNSSNTNGLSDLEITASVPTGGQIDCRAFSYSRFGSILFNVDKIGSAGTNQTLDYANSLN